MSSCRPRSTHTGIYLAPQRRGQKQDIKVDDGKEDKNKLSLKLVTDLPPVMAPPRRGQDARKGRVRPTGSRPPSIHVDDYG